MPEIVNKPPMMAHADVMKDKNVRRSSLNVTCTGLKSQKKKIPGSWLKVPGSGSLYVSVTEYWFDLIVLFPMVTYVVGTTFK